MFSRTSFLYVARRSFAPPMSAFWGLSAAAVTPSPPLSSLQLCRGRLHPHGAPPACLSRRRVVRLIALFVLHAHVYDS